MPIVFRLTTQVGNIAGNNDAFRFMIEFEHFFPNTGKIFVGIGKTIFLKHARKP